jgi:DeoR/GlpR family transcriptional regulator of sugar metabolism
MSLQVERQLAIHALIKEKQTVKVEDLAKRLDVSRNTIRRDLNMLEKRGILRRTQGGAVLHEVQHYMKQPYEQRSRSNTIEKRVIGKFAAKFVESGTTIILDAGTTTQQIALNLHQVENVTVATNSLEIANTLISHSNLTVILSGGILFENSRSLIGLPAENFFSQIHADQLFLGTRGITLENGLTNPNMYETPIKQKMLEVAREVILVADHDKFGKVALSPFAKLTRVHKIITDAKAPQTMIKKIEALGIEVLIAE